MTADMHSLLTEIVKALVDTPDDVRIDIERDEDATVFVITVPKSERGKIIGKQGRTARSLRTIATAIGTKQKTRYAIEVFEEDEM